MTVKVEALKRFPLFRALDTAALQYLLPLFREHTIEEGAHLFREGSPGDTLYVIRAGRARVLKPGDGEDTDVTLVSLGPGDVFGEMSLISNAPRSAEVLAVTQLDLWALTRERFETLKNASFPVYATIVKNLTVVLCHRLAAVTQRVANVIEGLVEAESRHEDATARLARSTKGLLDFLPQLGPGAGWFFEGPPA